MCFVLQEIKLINIACEVSNTTQYTIAGVGKLFSWRAALAIQELAEGRIDHL